MFYYRQKKLIRFYVSAFFVCICMRLFTDSFAGFEVCVFGVVSSQWNGSNWLSLFVQLGLRDE